MKLIATLIASKLGSIIIVILGFALIGGISVGIGHERAGNASGGGLPAKYESYQAIQAQGLIGAPPYSNAIVVVESNRLITNQEKLLLEGKIALIGKYSSSPFIPPVQYSDDGRAAILVVPLIQTDSLELINERVTSIRQVAKQDLPDRYQVFVTGPEGFANDLAHVFDGADIRLLVTTIIVVFVLLLFTYRSPILWVVPLFVVACADDAAGQLARVVAKLFNITPDASVNGILSVLVFGAGTNYALLLIARYREELLKQEDRYLAMKSAWISAAPAILASAITVALALSTLMFAQLQGTRALGIACATGVLLAVLLVLTWLPACLLVLGRWIFWPRVPRFGQPDNSGNGIWAGLGNRVSARPVFVAVAGTLILVVLAMGTIGLKIGLSSSEQFVSKTEAVYGQEILAEHFGAGFASPAFIVASNSKLQDVIDVAENTAGVALVTTGIRGAEATQLSVTLTSAPQTEASLTTVSKLRERVHAVDGANALVGGVDSGTLDLRAAQSADQALIIPIILAIVFVVLLILLRSLVAPVLLLLTVVASFFASLGASWVLFQNVFHFPALAGSTLLLSFLFLVALGVDYNIFLSTRALEESRSLGHKLGMIRALTTTGGVITSAGILLAAVFAVLGVLPLIALTQVGVIVCIGVLLDTLLVRTVIVPALAFAAGSKFWWPASASKPNSSL